jgi:hypothetical protein
MEKSVRSTRARCCATLITSTAEAAIYLFVGMIAALKRCATQRPANKRVPRPPSAGSE